MNNATLRQLQALHQALSEENIDHFLSLYNHNTLSDLTNRNIAVVMAGNLPLVGFMDIVYIILSGNNAIVKPSSNDRHLLAEVISRANLDNITLVDQIPTNIHAIIATGNDNTARHFDYHYRHLPRLIRHSRTSIAILTGNETNHQLQLLADDILSYSGRGCRNVSKIMIPHNYDFIPLIKALQSYPTPLSDPDYADNYLFNKSLMLTTRQPFIDTGVSIIYENQNLGTPISTLSYQYYTHRDHALAYANQHQDKLQCLVGIGSQLIPFGQTQSPTLADYADNIDVIRWIKSIFSR